MDENSGSFPSSFTNLTFRVADGRRSVMSTHDPVSEVKRLYEKVEEHVKELRANQHLDSMETVVDETTLPRDLRQDILSLYALSSALIERFSVEILVREMVEEVHRDNEAAEEVFEERGVSSNVRLLFDLGIIDNALHGELQSITGDRNDYVHDPASTLYIEDYDEFLSGRTKSRQNIPPGNVICHYIRNVRGARHILWGDSGVFRPLQRLIGPLTNIPAIRCSRCIW